MRNWRRWVSIVVGVLGVAGGVLFYLLHHHADLTRYDALRLPAATQTEPGEQVRVTWVGVSTLLIDDGETAFMTDGFFTRPGLLQLRNVAPDPRVVDAALERLHVRRLTAVIPLHSHYDHVLDSPLVAKKTQALLIGSSSTAQVGRGYGLPASRIRVVEDGEVVQLGRFQVTFVVSVHSPNENFAGRIDAPLSAPAKASAYRTGDCYSLLVEHGVQSLLVHASAGFVPGKLAGKRADVVYLGVGNLGKQSDEHRIGYWREVVHAVGAKRVIPIHWDDFFEPLSEPLVAMPPVMDDFDKTMRDLDSFAHREQIELRLPREWIASDPFAAPP